MASLYDSKPDRYYSGGHRGVLALLSPASAARVLDVGCGDGSLGASLKSNGSARQVVGVEAHIPAADRAKGHLDAVHAADFEQWQPPSEYHQAFDFVVFADVLEHLRDPEDAIRKAAALLRPDGAVVAAIPNVRWLPVVWDLAVRGNWTYQWEGVLDETHLRFFTRKSIHAMFERAGFLMERCDPVYRCDWPRIVRAPFRLLAEVSTTFEELYSIQYVVEARRADRRRTEMPGEDTVLQPEHSSRGADRSSK